MMRWLDPIPEIFAPIAISRLQRSTISGSRAALNNCDRPLASTAAMTAFSVAPTETIGKLIVAAGQAAPGRAGFDIARGELDLRAQALERLQMQVDRTIADRAAAGQRHRRLAGAGEQRPEHQHRRAHLAHHVVGCDGRGDLARLQRHPSAELALLDPGDAGRDAELIEQMAEGVDVGEARQVASASASRR